MVASLGCMKWPNLFSVKLFRSRKAVILTLKPLTEGHLGSGKLLQKAAFDMFALGDFPVYNEGLDGPQSTYRGRVEIGECICPLSWSVHHNFVRDGRYCSSERGWACTRPHQMSSFFHQPRMYARKWPLPLCVLCGQDTRGTYTMPEEKEHPQRKSDLIL
jgi:hypothetical protein